MIFTMKLTLKWLKEHLETNANVQEIVSTLAKIGLECDNVTFAQDAWHTVEIVKIIEKEKHPNADKLNLYTIELKNSETKKIVCGDGSLIPGNYVPYAAPGTIIPNGNFTIKISKIRGIESPGMLCAAQELLLPIEKSGVLQCFECDFGKTIAQAYEDTAILQIELTPNRGDAFAVRSVARALSFQGLGTLKPLKLAQHKAENKDNQTGKLFEIKSKNCLGLSAALLEYEVKSTAPEITKRLQLTGHTGTGIDVVDITNYVAHEIGQPMHAFDFSKIMGGKIILKNLEQESEFAPLIGESFILNKGTLVISDNEKIISWPGVMGAKNSKSELGSNKILIETGIFEIDSIQRRKHKIHTNAAKRFEYGVDLKNLAIAINRFCFLLDVSPVIFEIEECNLEKKIQFDLAYFKTILGKDYTIEQLRERLEPRGFHIADDLMITVPSYKYFDMHTPNCVVEEFIVGYLDQIESKNLPLKEIRNTSRSLELQIIEIAIQNGFYETCNFSITHKEHKDFNISEESNNIRSIKNASNSNYSILRATLIPQLLKIAQWHIANHDLNRNFFELSLIYGNFENTSTSLNTQQKIFTAISHDHKKLLAMLYNIFDTLNLEYPNNSAIEIAWQEHGISFIYNDILIASVGKIKETISNEFDITEYFALELFFENLANNLSKMPKTIHKKPFSQLPIYKDISFHLEPNVKIGTLTDLLKNSQYTFEIFDIYPSENLTCKRNVGIRFVFTENETLTTEQLNTKIAKIKKIVKEKLNIE